MASTFTCGGNFTRNAPLMYSGNVTSEPALKSVMMKSSIDRANDSSAAARMPGRMQRERDLPERSQRRRPEVLSCLFERPVEPADAGPHRERDEAHLEHDVGDHDGREPPVDVPVEEQRGERRAEHDLGRRQRKHQEEVQAAAAAEPVAGERDGDQRAEDRRDDGGDRRDLQALDERVGQRLVAERVLPVVERELLPRRSCSCPSGWLNEKTTIQMIGTNR